MESFDSISDRVDPGYFVWMEGDYNEQLNPFDGVLWHPNLLSVNSNTNTLI